MGSCFTSIIGTLITILTMSSAYKPTEVTGNANTTSRSALETIDYNIVAELSGEPTSNQRVFVLTFQAKQDWTIKEQTPLRVDLILPSNTTSKHTKFTQTDLKTTNKKTGTLRTSIATQGEGNQEMGIKMSFYLCTDKICQRFQGEFTIPLK